MENPAIETSTPENHLSERNETSERLQTEYNDSENPDSLSLTTNELQKWYQFGMFYCLSFFLLILYSKNQIPIQISILPLILQDLKKSYTSLIELQKCEQ